jgi:fucose permease
VGAETSFAGWMPTYAIRQGIVEVTTAAYFSSVFWAALTLGRLLWIPYTKRMSPDRIVIIRLLGCIVSMIIVYNFGKTVTILGLGIVMMGLSMSSVFPSALCSLERRVHMTGYINSLCLVSAALGGMFFPWLLGYAF